MPGTPPKQNDLVHSVPQNERTIKGKEKEETLPHIKTGDVDYFFCCKTLKQFVFFSRK